MANTWNQSGTTWSTGRWGTTEAIITGFGADTWNDGGSWGQANDEVALLTGQSITSSLGTPVASSEQGWGRDTWNFESWGFSGLTVELDGQEITSNLGVNGWSNGTYGENGWGMFTLNPADVMGVTGVSATFSIGSPTVILSPTVSLTGVSATASVGELDPAQLTLGISGVATTSAVGSVTLDLTSVASLTGVSSTAEVGDLIAGIVEFVPVTGVATTSAVGSIDLDQMLVGLTGVSSTSSVGAITPADVMGLTGVETISSVAAFGTATGFGIQSYQDVDTGSNTTYSDAA